MSRNEPTMSRKPDAIDKMAAEHGWAKDMQVMTPEQRKRMASLEFPRAEGDEEGA